MQHDFFIIEVPCLDNCQVETNLFEKQGQMGTSMLSLPLLESAYILGIPILPILDILDIIVIEA